MLSDLKLDIDGIRLNIRVGVVMRFANDVVIEVSTVGANSVIPGGRIKINESSLNALKREVKEEMGLELDINKAKQIKTFENFFEIDKKPFHEIYFLYEYDLSESELEFIKSIKGNKDNNTTYFKVINKFDLKKYNLLPLELHQEIQK